MFEPEPAQPAVEVAAKKRLFIVLNGAADPRLVRADKRRQVESYVLMQGLGVSVRILLGDCREVLKTLPDESVHCVVTSPPYWGMRDYGVPGQIGLDPTPQAYVEQLVSVFDQLRRVLRADGTAWLNVQDGYSAGGYGGGGSWGDKPEWQSIINRRGFKGAPEGWKRKELLGLPAILSACLSASGWYLRAEIVWSKPVASEPPRQDRPGKSHEYVFLLSLSPRYWFHRHEDMNKTVWEISPGGDSAGHIAAMPPELARRCILAGCPEFTCGACGTVLDSRYGKVRAGTKGKAVEAMQVVRQQGNAGSPKPCSELLQQGVCITVDGQEPQHDQRPLHDIEGIHRDLYPNSPGCVEGRLCDGAPAGNGEASRSTAAENGNRASLGWQASEQQTKEPGTDDHDGAQPSTEDADRINSLPALRTEDSTFSACPRCKAILDEVGVQPGVVLDCFGGAGTTGLVADRHGRDAILIELNPQYADMAERRIMGDAPLFAEVAA